MKCGNSSATERSGTKPRRSCMTKAEASCTTLRPTRAWLLPFSNSASTLAKRRLYFASPREPATCPSPCNTLLRSAYSLPPTSKMSTAKFDCGRKIVSFPLPAAERVATIKAKVVTRNAASPRFLPVLFQGIDSQAAEQFRIKVRRFLRHHFSGQGYIAHLLGPHGIQQESEVGFAFTHLCRRLIGFPVIG